LAITARTYAVANLGRHAADGFDLCDLTHCQVVARPTQAARRAAEGTAGLVLAYAGKPASVFYTASCGGISERAASVWPAAIDRPYIVERVDPLCRKDPGWTTELSVEQLSRALGAAGLRGKRVTDLRVAARTPSGRVALLSVSGFAPSEIGGDSFRLAVGRTAGWQVLKSASFDVARTAGGYRFTGRGAGHGVGLCLAGATRMARLGHTSASILSEYFPGTRVMGAKTGGTSLGDRREASSPGAGSSEQATGSTLETPGTRVEMRLQAGDEDERRAIAGLVRRALDSLSRALDVPLPPRVRLTFHPSAASYQRATGQPWWTSGASRRSEVDLIPLTNLRSRGTLEETLRHEIVHVLTSDLLVNRPAWVREGLAIHFAGEAAGAPPRHRAAPVSCPTDEDLLRSRSAASLEQAYRRAASCVARALASGISWRDIR
ncbi:MAG: SpoIID/LytB domain-containing protein, partial [Acidobacteria bacterium]